MQTDIFISVSDLAHEVSRYINTHSANGTDSIPRVTSITFFLRQAISRKAALKEVKL
jgi:hypothetical protein